MQLRHLLAGLVATAAISVAGAASAAQILLTIQPTTFSDGSHLSGSFVFDNVSSTFSSVNVVTDAHTYTFTSFGNASNVIFTTSAGPYTTSSPAIFIPAGGNGFNVIGATHTVVVTEGTCSDAPNCTGGVTPIRQANPATITSQSPPPAPPVPTLGEWSMILMAGLISLAGLGHVATRRRSFRA